MKVRRHMARVVVYSSAGEIGSPLLYDPRQLVALGSPRNLTDFVRDVIRSRDVITVIVVCSSVDSTVSQI